MLAKVQLHLLFFFFFFFFFRFETLYYNEIRSRAIDGVTLSSDDSLGWVGELFNKRNPASSTGKPALEPQRVVICAVIHTRHMHQLLTTVSGGPDHRKYVSLSGTGHYSILFRYSVPTSNVLPLDASLFVEIRKRMGNELLAENEW